MAHHNGDPGDRTIDTLRENRLVKKFYQLAIRTARKRAALCPEPYEDLLQVALIGLLKAIRSHDPDRDLEPFAVKKMNGEINHYLRNNWGRNIPCKPWIRDTYNRVRKAYRIYSAENPKVTMESIAALSGISEDRWEFIIAAIAQAKTQTLSLDQQNADDIELIERIASPEEEPEPEGWMIDAYNSIQAAHRILADEHPRTLDEVAALTIGKEQWALVQSAIATATPCQTTISYNNRAR